MATLKRMIARIALLCVTLGALCARSAAQDTAFERIEVRVTAASGALVVLDRGAQAGLAPDDRVRLFPFGAPLVEGRVRSLAADSSTAELASGAPAIEIGTLGEVLVPRERLERTEPAPPQSGPEHPPWEHPPEAWESEQPLLAPAHGRAPEERPARVSGRAFLQSDLILDHGASQSEYLLARGGIDLLWENPFRRGGALAFDGEVFHRTADFNDASDEAETLVRPRRLSYASGGVRGEPNRYEIGRFLSHEFPEFGLVDGFEYARRTESGDRFGFSAGFLPEPTDELRTGRDLAGALFYRAVFGADEELALGTGYQKSWHEGQADRDLFVGNVAWRASSRLFVHAAAWIDYYGGADDLKAPGFEVTQLSANAAYRSPAGHSLGFFGSLVRWPQVLRSEFASLPDEEIRNGEVQRVGLYASRKLSEHTRLSGRADVWRDQDDDGSNGDLRLSLRDLLFERGEVSFSGYFTRGKFSSGLGLRSSATKRFAESQVVLAFDVANLEQDSDFAGTQDLLQSSLRAEWDTTLGAAWDLSLFLEERFGDQQDSTALGFLLQRRF